MLDTSRASFAPRKLWPGCSCLGRFREVNPLTVNQLPRLGHRSLRALTSPAAGGLDEPFRGKSDRSEEEVRMAKFRRFITGLVLVGATVGAGLGAVVLGGTAAGAPTPITVNDAGDGGAVPASCTRRPRVMVVARRHRGRRIGRRRDHRPARRSSVPQQSQPQPISTPSQCERATGAQDSGHTVTITGAGPTLAIIQMQASPPTASFRWAQARPLTSRASRWRVASSPVLRAAGGSSTTGP